jgi:hypothetical protein
MSVFTFRIVIYMSGFELNTNSSFTVHIKFSAIHTLKAYSQKLNSDCSLTFCKLEEIP